MRFAIIVSHPIQYLAPWYRELARLPNFELKVFFCCDWGYESYSDPGFKTNVKWDIPLVEGYSHEFLAIARAPRHLTFCEVDNPSVTVALDKFQPDIVKVCGYAYRTNWRVAEWTRQNRRPLLLYSDSNIQIVPPWWKRFAKDLFVGTFYRRYVDGAFFIGENNRQYHANYGVPTERLFQGAYPIEIQRLLKSISDPSAVRCQLRQDLGIPLDAFVILFCGKYQRHKRPLDVVRAVHMLARKGLPVWCLLVGDGAERARIAAFCEREEAFNVVRTGFVNQSSIARYYTCSDVLAISSSLEPYGLVVTEAATLGLPIIASNRVGCIGENDAAQPERNAIVYPCGDIEALATAIERLWVHPDLYQSMARKSRQIATSQDVAGAADQLAVAARKLEQLGPRRMLH